MPNPTNRVSVEISAEASKATAAVNEFFTILQTKQAFIENFNKAWSNSAARAQSAVATQSAAAKTSTQKFIEEFNAAWDEGQRRLTQYTFSAAAQRIKEANELLSYPTFTKAGVGVEALAKNVVKSEGALASFVSTARQATSGLNALAMASTAYIGTAALGSFVRESISAQGAAARLDAALRSSGQASAGYTKELREQREEFAKTSTLDDDSLVALQQRLVTMGVTRDMMKQATQITLDYSAATGRDAVTAAQLLGNALAGDEVAGLRGFRIEIDKTLPKGEQMRLMFQQLGKQVGGQALAQFKIAPEYYQFIKSISDLKRELGALVIESGIFGWLQSVVQGLRALPDWAKTATLALGGFLTTFTGISVLVSLAWPGLTAMGGLLTKIGASGAIGGYYLSGLAVALRVVVPMVGLAVAAFRTLNEYLAALKARTEVGTAVNNMIDSTVKLKQTTISALNKMVEQGGITQEQAQVQIDAISRINKAWLKGTLTVDDYHRLIVLAAQATQAMQVPNLPTPKLEQVSAAVQSAYEKGYAEVSKAQLEADKANLEASYKAKETSDEEYFARRRAIITAELDWELKASTAEGDKIAAEKVRILNDNSIQAAEKKKQADEQDAKYVELAFQQDKMRVEARQKLAEVDRDQVNRNREIRDSELSEIMDVQSARDQELQTEEQRMDQEQADKKQHILETIEDEERMYMALDLLDQTYSAKKAKYRADLAKQNAQITRDQTTTNIGLAQQKLTDNWRYTDDQKVEASTELLRQQVEADDQYIESLQRLKEQYADNEDKVREYNEALREAYNTRAKDDQSYQTALNAPKSNSYLDQLTVRMVQLKQQWGSMARSMAEITANTVTTAVRGLADALTSVIMGTKSVGEAFQQMAVTMVTSLIASILEAVLYALVAIPILTALGILSGGSIPATGMTTTALALAAGASMASAYGRARGGPISGPGGPRDDQVPVWASNGEWFIQQPSAAYYGNAIMDAINRRLIPRSALEEYARGGYAQATRFAFADGGQVSGGGNGQASNVNVAIYDRWDQMRQYLESHEGQSVLVRAIRKNAGEVGFRR